MAGVGTQWLESQINGRCFLIGCCSNILSVRVSPFLVGKQLVGATAQKDSGKKREGTLDSSTPTSITGKAKAMKMAGLWGRVALTGMAVANTAEARATTTLRLHGTHS